jgi:hypothetical protein
VIILENDIGLANKIIEGLENIEPTEMTVEETAILIQRQIDLAKSLSQLETSKKLFLKKFFEHQDLILKLDAEIAASEDFITYKGLRNEYQRFKDKQLKILNQKKKRLFR